MSCVERGLFDQNARLVGREDRQRDGDADAPSVRELGLGVVRERRRRGDVRHPERLRQRHLRALLFDAAIEHRELRAAGCARARAPRWRRRDRRRRSAVDSGCTVSSGCPSSALSFDLAATAAAFGRGRLVLRRGQGEVGLQHFEPRRITGLEARLRRVARTLRQVAQLPQDRQPGVGDQRPRSMRAGRRCGPARSSPPAPRRRSEWSPR